MTKRISSLILFAVLSTCVVIRASAQEQLPTSTQPAQRGNGEALARRLALTHEQQVQFRDIHKEQKAQLAAVAADTTLSPHARRQKVREIRATTETKIRSILNQNQLDEYDQIKRERQESAQRKREAGVAIPQSDTPETAPHPQ